MELSFKTSYNMTDLSDKEMVFFLTMWIVVDINKMQTWFEMQNFPFSWEELWHKSKIARNWCEKVVEIEEEIKDWLDPNLKEALL